LLFLGASLLEEFVGGLDRSRVKGVRADEDGAWLRLQPAIYGTESLLFVSRKMKVKKRRMSWMTGVGWEEDWAAPDRFTLTAPHLSIRVQILERTHQAPAALEAMELKLPDDVRIVKGSRK
jgi:hypothetical protein